jgi:hypothetical protein
MLELSKGEERRGFEFLSFFFVFYIFSNDYVFIEVGFCLIYTTEHVENDNTVI